MSVQGAIVGYLIGPRQCLHKTRLGLADLDLGGYVALQVQPNTSQWLIALLRDTCTLHSHLYVPDLVL